MIFDLICLGLVILTTVGGLIWVTLRLESILCQAADWWMTI